MIVFSVSFRMNEISVGVCALRIILRKIHLIFTLNYYFFYRYVTLFMYSTPIFPKMLNKQHDREREKKKLICCFNFDVVWLSLNHPPMKLNRMDAVIRL